MKFKPILLSVAEFANGQSFRIDRVKASGACRVTDLVTNKVRNYTHSESAAWRSIMFNAGVDGRTGRSVDQETQPAL
jgi:hypothetical protein